MVKYTESMDKQILIAVIQEMKCTNPSSTQWDAITARLNFDGGTASGISQRFSKKLMKEPIGDGGTPASGNKRKGTPSTNTSKSNKKNKTMGMDDDNEESPALAAHAKKRASKVKAEPKDDDQAEVDDYSPAKAHANGRDDFDLF